MKKILFWGAQCHTVWIKNFIFQTLEGLRPHGWAASYYFQPYNEYDLGYDTNTDYRPEWYPNDQPFSPDVHLLKSLPISLYFCGDPERTAEILRPYLPPEAPDIILTRLDGQAYLSKIYPDTPIVTIGDVFNRPWLLDSAYCLRTDSDNCGMPFLDKHKDWILENTKFPDNPQTSIRTLVPASRLIKQQKDNLEKFFGKLRKEFRKIVVMPLDKDGADVRYMEFAAKHERFQTKTDQYNYLLENTPDDVGFLVTRHPSEKILGPLSQHERLILEDNPAWQGIHDNISNPRASLHKTEYLVPFCDAVAVRNSKAYWLGYMHNKPILNLGRQAINFIEPFTAIEPWLAAREGNVSAETGAKFLYWVLTRHRIGVFERTKLIRSLDRFCSTSNAEAHDNPALYEWGTEEEYLSCFKALTTETYKKLPDTFI